MAVDHSPDERPFISPPVPDPTLLTTEQLIRVVNGLDRIITTRLDGMDKAIDLIQRAVDRSPSIAEVALSVEDLEKLLEVKIDSLREFTKVQFDLNSKSVETAFAAQKEAVREQNSSNAASIAKSENSTNNQLKALGEKIDDVKERVGGSEGRHKGGTEVWGYIVGAAGFIMALATLLRHWG